MEGGQLGTPLRQETRRQRGGLDSGAGSWGQTFMVGAYLEEEEEEREVSVTKPGSLEDGARKRRRKRRCGGGC